MDDPCTCGPAPGSPARVQFACWGGGALGWGFLKKKFESAQKFVYSH